MNLNNDYNTRDQLLFGQDYDPELYTGGIRYFDDISYSLLKKLVDMQFANPEECQNDSPSINELLSAFEDYEDYISFSGYSVSPDRRDYRISIDEIKIEIPKDNTDMLSYAVEYYRYADEFHLSAAHGNFYVIAWWD